MRFRAEIGLVLLLLVGGTACSTASPEADLLEPEIRMVQLPGTSFAMRYQGRIAIRYLVEIENRSAETLELERIALRVIGQAPYSLQSEAVPSRRTIAPGATDTFELNVQGYSLGGAFDPNDHVAIRGIAHFDSEMGKFRTTFTAVIRQPDDAGLR